MSARIAKPGMKGGDGHQHEERWNAQHGLPPDDLTEEPGDAHRVEAALRDEDAQVQRGSRREGRIR